MTGNALPALREAERLHATGNLKAAVKHYQEAIDTEPDNPECWYGCGVASLAMRDYKLAIKFLEAARLCGEASVNLEYNLGISNDALGRYASAELHYREALALEPDSILPHVTLGGMLYRLGRPLEGYRHHSLAIAKPANPEGEAGRAHIHLLRGDYRRGWREYESRLQVPEYIAQHPTPDYGKPWRGQKLRADRRLLLHHEQGIGDTIQMLRFIPQIAAMGSPITLMVQPLLKRLVEAQGYPVEHVVVRGEGFPVPYFHCPLMSLPWALRDQGGLFPFWEHPYIKASEDTDIPKLPATDKLRVGIQWHSDSAHQNAKDRNAPFKHFVKLFAVKGVEWVNVNVPRPPNTLERVKDVEVLDAEINDFADTAVVVSQVDLVICIDSAAGHLAGALGTPVWLMAPSAPEFRWQLDTSRSAWYPNHTIYRRAASDAWPEVIERLKHDLEVEVGKRG